MGALLLWSGGAFAQADKFEDQPPAPAGYGADGTLIRMCNENDVQAALRECQSKIRTYETEIREFERRKARKDNDATSRQLQWLRGMQYELTATRTPAPKSSTACSSSAPTRKPAATPTARRSRRRNSGK